MGPLTCDDEPQRLAVLHETQVLDTDPEADFDDIAALAAEMCRMPIGMVSLIDADRQWIKARIGWQPQQTSREGSLCTYALPSSDVFQIDDAATDPRFVDHPLVVEHGVRFYAGMPVRLDRHPVGTVCVMDTRPRQLTGLQQRVLRALARHAAAELELRRYAHRVGELTERLRELDRLQDTFLDNVNHELRTPLAAIRGYLELLSDGEADTDTSQRFMTVISRNADRLLRLVDDLLLVTGLRSADLHLDRVDVNLADLAYQAILACRSLGEHKNLTITQHTGQPVTVYADPRRLCQAIDHLLFNAIHFTPPGGEVTVEVTAQDQPTLTITDTGVGIPAADLPKVYDKFYRGAAADTLAAPGTGLGLTIVKAIIDAHDGSLTINSRAGHGTAAMITLPNASGCANADGQPTAQPPNPPAP